MKIIKRKINKEEIVDAGLRLVETAFTLGNGVLRLLVIKTVRGVERVRKRKRKKTVFQRDDSGENPSDNLSDKDLLGIIRYEIEEAFNNGKTMIIGIDTDIRYLIERDHPGFCDLWIALGVYFNKDINPYSFEKVRTVRNIIRLIRTDLGCVRRGI